jgi:CheY-like chemotaxis protein
MSSHEGFSPTTRRRVLVVEDEILIGMLLEDMLGELGYAIAATASRVEEATALARDGEFDAAILDVNLNGQDVYPVADILAGRGIPFVFATGYGERGLPPTYQHRPTLQKPFQQETLERHLVELFAGKPSL